MTRPFAAALALCATAALAAPLAQSPPELLSRMDADGDGRVALGEYQDYLSAGFRALDVDHSGTLVLIIGHFLAIDRPRLLRFTWSNSNWPDPTMASVVNVTFEPHGDDETLMEIEHSLLPAYEQESFHNGWARTAEQLEAVLRDG